MQKPVALITGASAGIGFEMAKVFAARGYDLIIVARTAKKLKEFHKQISPLITVTDIAMDLTSPNAAARLFTVTQKKKLKVDVLVNNAGFGSNGHFVELDRKNELQEIDLNVRVLTELCHFYGKEMA
ncbi:MAG TPA: SDR family NAD(P)-dependent oxidoreductase, partial [Turneriella sp.]|nr:SDR family NAD(P)-dependent oxidoreductase [Turneriella sp.]